MVRLYNIFKSRYSLLFLGVIFMQTTIQSDTRESVVSGSFYSENAKELSSQVKELLQNSPHKSEENINALIVPHAGYVYSASTAAKAYSSLHKKYKNIFIIGSSHHVNIDGASIYSIGNYKTPLGEVHVNQSIVTQLMQNTELYSYYRDAHTKEHTLEVQLPFLQTLYSDDLQIVPIIIATQNLEIIKQISKSLEKYFTDDNLFIISTDLSHFPSFNDANTVDMKTLNSIATNDTKTFIDNLVENENAGLKEFHTSACGWSSILTLMYLTQDKNYNYELLEYINSGHTKYGDKSHVVGYGAMRIYKENSYFDEKEKQQLLDIARLALNDAVKKNEKVSLDSTKIYPKLKDKNGAFVTLYKSGNLRGCIGQFEPDQSLSEVIVDMSISSALHDSRFNKVSIEELEEITIEISVLTPRKKINSIDEIVIGKHGIYLQYGSKNGTYLPHVATQMNWNAKEFVEHCALEKAGISKDDLKNIEIFVYEAIIIKN